jgi:hypothetical protein
MYNQNFKCGLEVKEKLRLHLNHRASHQILQMLHIIGIKDTIQFYFNYLWYLQND